MSTDDKKKNGYYYWHHHEKQRAAVGDVAAMPTPMVVATDPTACASSSAAADRVLPTRKFSWDDGSKRVTVYLDTSYGGVGGEVVEELQDDSVAVDFTFCSVDVRYTGLRRDTKAVVRRQFSVPFLCGDIDPEKSSFQIKPSKEDGAKKQIVVKLVKREEKSWFELKGKERTENEKKDSDAEEDPKVVDEEETLE